MPRQRAPELVAARHETRVELALAARLDDSHVVGLRALRVAEHHQVVRILAEVDDLDDHAARVNREARECERELLLHDLDPSERRRARLRGRGDRGYGDRGNGERGDDRTRHAFTSL